MMFTLYGFARYKDKSKFTNAKTNFYNTLMI